MLNFLVFLPHQPWWKFKAKPQRWRGGQFLLIPFRSIAIYSKNTYIGFCAKNTPCEPKKSCLAWKPPQGAQPGLQTPSLTQKVGLGPCSGSQFQVKPWKPVKHYWNHKIRSNPDFNAFWSPESPLASGISPLSYKRHKITYLPPDTL